MRYLIVSLLFFTANCSQHGHQNPGTNHKIDSTKFFVPNLKAENEVGNILNDCLMLDKDSIAVVLNGQKYNMGNTIELNEFLQHNSPAIVKKNFYVVYANNISENKIIEIIDIVKAAKIDNYKIVKSGSLFILHEPKEE
ncbi:hypothetical protein [Ferruginibacter profundus]